MKSILTAILLMLVASPVTFTQTSDKRSRYDSTVAEEIKRMDRQWLVESYAPNDMSAFDRIVADDFMITHSRGRVLDKAQKRADIISNHSQTSAQSPTPSTESAFRIEDSSVRVRVYKDVAISTGYIIEKDLSQGRNDHVYFTNTYLKRKGRWQVVASQLTRVPQPK